VVGIGRKDSGNSQYSRDLLIRIKGTVCSNCQLDVKDDIIFHHVIPIVKGGYDVITNIIPLCTCCHNLVHHGKKSGYSHSELVKLGLEKARMENKHIGRKQITYHDLDESIKMCCKMINDKEITISEAARQLGISRPSVYKYLSLYDNYNGGTNYV